MGAKFVALSTPTATVNTTGIACKVDVDCTNGKGVYGVNKTSAVALTDAASIARTCCMYYAPTIAPNGTTAEIAVGDAT